MASRWGASSWTASSTWESDHLDQWVEWAWTWAWKVSGTTCSPASVRPIATQRGNICRANQGITCLTEGYGAWQRDSLTSWRQQPTANPSVHLQDPTTFYAADICNVEAFHDRLQSSTMYPATVTVTHRRSNLVQLIWPPPVLTDPCFFSGGHLTLPPLPLPTNVHMDSSIKSDCDCEHRWHTRDTLCPLLVTFGECSTWWYILGSLANKRDFLWRALHSFGWWNWTKEKPMSVSDRTLTKKMWCP